MAKRKPDEAFLALYEDIKIVYPFCYMTPNQKNFFRYLEDGRYEYLCFENNRVTFSFGARAQSIESLLSDDEFYFKVLHSINTIITNEEFEFRRNLYTVEYNKYLEGDKYLAREVEKILAQEQRIYGTSENKSNDDIITNQGLKDPF